MPCCSTALTTSTSERHKDQCERWWVNYRTPHNRKCSACKGTALWQHPPPSLQPPFTKTGAPVSSFLCGLLTAGTWPRRTDPSKQSHGGGVTWKSEWMVGNDCFEGKVHSPLGLVQPYLLRLPGSRLSWESRANMVSAPCLTHALLPPRTPGPYNWKSHQLTSKIQVQRSQFGSSICNVKSKSYSTLCI